MGSFLSGDAARDRFADLLDRVDAAYRAMGELPCDEVGNRYRVEMARRLETQERLNRALMYRVFGQIADPPDETTMVPDVKQRLAARLRIPVREVTPAGSRWPPGFIRAGSCQGRPYHRNCLRSPMHWPRECWAKTISRRSPT